MRGKEFKMLRNTKKLLVILVGLEHLPGDSGKWMINGTLYNFAGYLNHGRLNYRK